VSQICIDLLGTHRIKCGAQPIFPGALRRKMGSFTHKLLPTPLGPTYIANEQTKIHTDELSYTTHR